MIGLPVVASTHFFSPAFMRFRSVRKAMLEKGRPCTCPGNTNDETRALSISRTISAALGDKRDAERLLAVLAVLQACQRYGPKSVVEIDLIPGRLQNCIGPDVGQNEKLKSAGGDGVASTQFRHEGRHLIVGQRWVATFRKRGRSVEAHRLQIVPASRVVGHRYAVFVPENDAGTFEDAPNGGIELARDLGFRSPDRPQDRRHVERRDFVHWPIK